jgi:predicted metal-dependent hydrolase
MTSISVQLSLFDDTPITDEARAFPVSPGRSLPLPPAAPTDVSLAVLSAHPRASREVHLRGHRVAYEFRRARRRSIGFSVCDEGLSVSAPRWVSVAEVEAALHEKARWILRKLAEMREHAERLRAARIDWRDGASVPYLGEPLVVVLDPRAAAAPGGARLAEACALPGVARRTLHVGLPQFAQPTRIRESVQVWLKREALRIFEERCVQFAPRLGVRVTRLALSSAATRWGSASEDGSILLNWRLVHFAMPVIDYVVVHELAHLRHMDHSPQFWDVVRSVMPEYQHSRGTLSDHVLPVFD